MNWRLALGADVEIDHPQRDAANKSDHEGADMLGGPGETGKRRAGDQDRFAKRDDDEQAAAFRYVAALDNPVRGGRPAKPRHRKPITGAIDSIATATPHSASRNGASTNAPASQNGAIAACQAPMRRKLR